MNFHSIEDYQDKLAGKKVFLRADTNATLEKGAIPLTQRVQAAVETIRFLSEKGASVIVATHNGREGESSFVSIGPLFLLLSQQHPELPKWSCPGNTFDSDRMGLNSDAIKHIKSMQSGDILILENIRFLTNETANMTREQFSQEKFVRDLLDCGVEYYVLDGFSVAHRGHMSIVGFPQIPNLSGLCLKKELEGSTKVRQLIDENKSGSKKVTFILGGAKIQDYLSLVESALKAGTVSKILVGGLLSQMCLFAKGYELGENSKKPLLKQDSEGNTIWQELERVQKWLNDYPDVFVLPVDVAYSTPDKGRQEFAVSDIPTNVKNQEAIFDIGEKTTEMYKQVLQDSDMAYWKGPIGAFDLNPVFGKGSEGVLSVIKNNSKIYSVMGGGDTGQMLQHFSTTVDEISYVSLAGGALIKILAGKKLPGLEVLAESYEKFPLS